jgi:hypothetical protein
MISIGFVASRVDGGLLVLEDQDTVGATGVLDFDDLLIIANEGLIGQIKDRMKKMFRMQDLGSFSFYLCMNIECNQEPSKIDLNLYRYIGMILAKFRMHESRPVATRMGMKLVWRTPNKEACDPTVYRSMIINLMYVMTTTQPDIRYPIGVLTRYNHDPSNEHMVALQRMFWNLNGTKDWRLGVNGALGGAL